MASVKGYVMVDDEGKPILAAYHNISSGRTESALTVWGKDYFGELKIVDVNIRRLRLKIEEDAAQPKHITTVWGYGYKWEG